MSRKKEKPEAADKRTLPAYDNLLGETSVGATLNCTPKALESQGENRAKPVYPFNPAGIPAELRELPQWVCFNFVRRGDKWAKPPIDAKVNDSTTWRTFDEAINAWERNPGLIDGVGFVLTPANGLCFVDFDNVLDSNGVLDSRVAHFVAQLDSFTERSVSGKGLHCICRATKPAGKKQRALDEATKIELYASNRYFTVTGDVFGGKMSLTDCQETVNLIQQYIDASTASATKSTGGEYCLSDVRLPSFLGGALCGKLHSTGMTDEQVIALIKRDKTASPLWEGDRGAYDDNSAADGALILKLGFYSQGNVEQTLRLMRQSGLARGKWDELRGGETWLEKEVMGAISRMDVFYQPERRSLTPAIFEKGGKTFVAKVLKDKSTAVEVANFTMRLQEKVWNDDRICSWRVTLTQTGEKDETIALTGSELNLAHQFREKISEKGTYLVHQPAYHNAWLEFVRTESASTLVEKRLTQYLGRATRRTAFAFCNALAIPGGSEPIANFVPPKGALKLTMPTGGELGEFWRETTETLFEVYGAETWKVLGFAVGSVCIDAITEEFGFFPLLFVNGPKGLGKSKLGELISRMFGAHRELKPFNFNSTGKAWFRQAMKYRGIPLVLNEYQPTKKNNSTLQGIYDREGYHRAKTSNDLETHKTDVNATFVLLSTRNVTGFESEALVSRLVTFDFSKVERTQETKERVHKLRGTPELSSFVPLALTIDEPTLIKAINAEISAVERSTMAESRLIENHCILKACANAFLDVVGLRERYGVGDISGDIAAQQTATGEANAAHLFLSLLRSELAASPEKMKFLAWEDDNLAGEAKALSFRFAESYIQVKRLAGQIGEKTDLPDEKTLLTLLKVMGAKPIRPYVDGRQVKAWTIATSEDVSPDESEKR